MYKSPIYCSNKDLEFFYSLFVQFKGGKHSTCIDVRVQYKDINKLKKQKHPNYTLEKSLRIFKSMHVVLNDM